MDPAYDVVRNEHVRNNHPAPSMIPQCRCSPLLFVYNSTLLKHAKLSTYRAPSLCFLGTALRDGTSRYFDCFLRPSAILASDFFHHSFFRSLVEVMMVCQVTCCVLLLSYDGSAIPCLGSVHVHSSCTSRFGSSMTG